jgi:ferrous-iron efflux pump FieF
MHPAMTILEAHDVVEALEKELCEAFPGTEILIHVDPDGHVDEPDNPMTEANLLKDS